MTYKQWCALMPRTQEQKRAYKIKAVKHNFLGLGMVILPFLGFLCFTTFPIILSFVISFSRLRSVLIQEAVFDGVGISNYIYVLKDEYTWYAMRTTLVYATTAFINLAIAVFLANVMHKKIIGQKVWLVVFFLPQMFSGVAITLMFRWIFASTGVINTMLMNMNLKPIDFFTDSSWFMPSVMLMSAWQHCTNIVVLLSAFAGINKSLQEAARLDGANELHVFWKITFPQLTPTIFYLLTMNLISALQEQGVFQLLNTTGTGPNFWGLTLTFQMYRLVSINFSYGLSCALSWVICLFIMLITRINFWLSKKWVSYD